MSRKETTMVTTHVRYAFNRREGAQSNGTYHAVLDQPLRAGRLRRKAGDALCRPRTRFWGLERSSVGQPVTCRRCLELAQRLNIVAEVAV